MPGLTGIISKTDIPRLETPFRKMMKSLLHKSWYKTDSYITPNTGIGRVHLGIFNPGRQPIFNEDKSLYIFLDGKIYGYDREKNALKNKGHKFSTDNDPEFCLHLYETLGESFVQKINGNFVIAIYDTKKKEFFIFNDRYGLRPHYYSVCDDKLFFAPESRAILQGQDVKPGLEEEALASFLSFGGVWGDKTFFKNIYLLPPASILRYRDGEVLIRQYWDFPYEPDYNMSEGKITQELVKRFKRAVEIRTGDEYRYGISLSGGLDSRAIVAAIDRKNKKKFLLFTFGVPDCSEVKLARKVAKRASMKLEFIRITPEIIIENAKKEVEWTEGLDYIGVSFNPFTRKILKDKIDIAIDGFALDLTLGGSYLDKFTNIKNEEDLTSAICRLRIFSDEDFHHLFNDKHRNALRKLPLLSLKRLLGNIKDENLENKIDHLYLQNHVRRFTLGGHVMNMKVLEGSVPTYDKDLIDLILKIPPTLRKNHYLYRKFLKILTPTLSSIPYDKTMLRPDLPIVFWKMSMQYQHYLEAVKRRIRRLFQNKIFLPPKKTYVNFYEWFYKNKKWQNYFSELLLNKNTPCTREYFNQDYIKQLFKEQFSGRKDNSRKILYLATFELFLKLFL